MSSSKGSSHQAASAAATKLLNDGLKKLENARSAIDEVRSTFKNTRNACQNEADKLFVDQTLASCDGAMALLSGTQVAFRGRLNPEIASVTSSTAKSTPPSGNTKKRPSSVPTPTTTKSKDAPLSSGKKVRRYTTVEEAAIESFCAVHRDKSSLDVQLLKEYFKKNKTAIKDAPTDDDQWQRKIDATRDALKKGKGH